MGPGPGRRYQRLGFAQHLTPAPESNRDVARPSKAPPRLTREQKRTFSVSFGRLAISASAICRGGAAFG